MDQDVEDSEMAVAKEFVSGLDKSTLVTGGDSPTEKRNVVRSSQDPGVTCLVAEPGAIC
jgi:hypothetical protein